MIGENGAFYHFVNGDLKNSVRTEDFPRTDARIPFYTFIFGVLSLNGSAHAIEMTNDMSNLILTSYSL